MKTKRIPNILAATLLGALAITTTRAADAPKMNDVYNPFKSASAYRN